MASNNYFNYKIQERKSGTLVSLELDTHCFRTFATGKTLTEAIDSSKANMLECLAMMAEDGENPLAALSFGRPGAQSVILNDEALFPLILRYARSCSGLTRKAMAERSGMNAEAYANLERPGSNTSPEYLQRIERVLGVSLMVGDWSRDRASRQDARRTIREKQRAEGKVHARLNADAEQFRRLTVRAMEFILGRTVSNEWLEEIVVALPVITQLSQELMERRRRASRELGEAIRREFPAEGKHD